ncbi:hypothetical protein [Moorena producens]|nr:hypothetical protein [Moorena producens]
MAKRPRDRVWSRYAIDLGQKATRSRLVTRGAFAFFEESSSRN